jgi:hypothetical protein
VNTERLSSSRRLRVVEHCQLFNRESLRGLYDSPSRRPNRRKHGNHYDKIPAE